MQPSTVSRVASGDPLARVAAEKRERIEALLWETRCRPSGIAPSLKLRQAFVLGMIVPVEMTLSCDDRAVDGARAAAFLTELGDLVEASAAPL